MKKIKILLFIITILSLTIRCNNNCSQCETDKTTLQQQLATCNTENSINQTKITDLEQQLQICNDKNDTNQAKIILLTHQLSECNSANDANQVKIAELTQQLNNCNQADLTQQLENCKTNNTTLLQQIILINQQLSDCNSNKAVLTQQLVDCNNDNVANKAKIILLIQQLTTCNNDNAVLQEQINTLTQQVITCENDKVLLQQQLTTCNNDKVMLQQQTTVLIQQLSSCNQANTTNQAKIATLTQQLNICNTDKTTLQQQIAVLTQQLSSCNNDKKNLNDSIVKLNDSINKLNTNKGNTRLWGYTYNIPTDSAVFNFWYSSDVSAPYQTRTSVGSLIFDQYIKVSGYERIYNKSPYKLNANAAYLEIIIYDSTFIKVLFNDQFQLIEMLPQTEYKFEWNTGNFTLPYLGKYYISKVLYEKKGFKDRPLEGGYFTFITTNDLHTYLKIKTYPIYTVKNSPKLRVFVNSDTTTYHFNLDRMGIDSTYVLYISENFKNIKSLGLKTDTNLIVKYAYLSSMDLLKNPTIPVTGIVNDNGVYKILVKPLVPITTNPLVAEWKFNGNGIDVMGKYPLTINDPINMFVSTNNAEGIGNISFQGSTYYATAGIMPIGNEFSFCFWFKTYNSSSDVRPQFGNAVNYYPNGYICMLDEINKGVSFCTGDGTARNTIFSNDNVWITGKWINVVITGSRTTGTGKLYINGVDQTRASSTGIFKTFPTTQPLVLGKSSNAGPAWSFMDDFRIYNRVLTPAEVVKVYNLQTIQ